MGKHRKLLISVCLLVLAGAGLGVYIYWQLELPPRLARLLPAADRVLYVDVRPLRLWDWGKSSSLHMEGDYQEFVDQTGIQFERDLNQAAVSWRDTEKGDAETAAIFVGRFDAQKLSSYLGKLTSRTESYRDLTIYPVPHEGHTVRACLLDAKTVAITNVAGAEMIHGVIDRWRGAPAEPGIVESYYKQVPKGSLGWLIDRFPPGSGATQLPDGLSFSFLENTVAVVSAGYNGSLTLRADVFAASEADARKIMDSATAFLGVYRSVSRSIARGGDPDVKAVLESIRVEQNGNQVVIRATLSKGFLKKIAAETQPQKVTAPTP
jgi:hypothetical protein